MILCVGTTPAVQRSMQFASLQLDHVNRAVSVHQSAAGKGINVARVLTTLGVDALTTGFLGGDTGDYIRRELDREGIAHRFVNVPFATRTCTTVIDKTMGTSTELVEESQEVSPDQWRELEMVVESSLPRCKALVLSGSLPPNAPQQFYATCARLAAARDLPVVVDARGEALRLALAHRPAMVKPNRHELEFTLNHPLDTDQALHAAIAQLQKSGARSALITMGSAGAIFFDGTQFWSLPAPPLTPVNPIGSGDSVAAGFIAGLVQGLPPLQCARLGIACGSANALTPTPAQIHPADVQRLREQIIPSPCK